jgi:hypothetical protein
MIKVILVINLVEEIGAMYRLLHNHLPHGSSELICKIKAIQTLKDKEKSSQNCLKQCSPIQQLLN